MSFEAHFTLSELCRSQKAKEMGIENKPSDVVTRNLRFTIAGLERVRHVLEQPMRITSGYRCPTLNFEVGGVSNSQHVSGQACDFVCPTVGTPRQVAVKLMPWVKVLGIDQLILESEAWVHISFTHEPRGEVLTYREGQYLNGIV